MKNKFLLNLSCIFFVFLVLFLIQNYKPAFVYGWFSDYVIGLYFLVLLIVVIFLFLYIFKFKYLNNWIIIRFWVFFLIFYFILSLGDRTYYYDKLNVDYLFSMNFTESDKEKLSKIGYSNEFNNNILQERENYIRWLWYNETIEYRWKVNIPFIINYEKVLDTFRINIYYAVMLESTPTIKLPNPLLGYKTYISSKIVQSSYFSWKSAKIIEIMTKK